MKKFVPYEKMSKKQKRELDSQRRGSWQGVSPVTRIAETDKKHYSRKIKHKKNGSGDVSLLPFCFRKRSLPAPEDRVCKTGLRISSRSRSCCYCCCSHSRSRRCST